MRKCFWLRWHDRHGRFNALRRPACADAHSGWPWLLPTSLLTGWGCQGRTQRGEAGEIRPHHDRWGKGR